MEGVLTAALLANLVGCNRTALAIRALLCNDNVIHFEQFVDLIEIIMNESCNSL